MEPLHARRVLLYFPKMLLLVLLYKVNTLQIVLLLCVHQLVLQISFVYMILLLLQCAPIAPPEKKKHKQQMLMQCFKQTMLALMPNAHLVSKIIGANGMLV